MRFQHRITLWLLALPFSAALALAVFFLLELDLPYRLAMAAAVFIVSELTLHHLAAKIPARTGPEALRGSRATVVGDFEEDGEGALARYVRVNGERWRARAPLAQRDALRAGAPARIERIEGLTVWVAGGE
ncbi:MAG TPA: NfeD family protein [Pelomicrobium sp.]|nr:NfeD family protein [Pelomicrobium sp.]